MAATPTADATNAPLATATDTTVDVVLPSATDTHMDTHMDTAAATNMTPPPKDVHSAALDWLCAPEHSGRLVKSLSVPRDEVTRLLGRVMGACDDHGFYHCREWAMLTYRILSTGVTPTGAPVAPAADLLVEDARVTWPLDAKAGSASAAADAVEKAREQSAASPAVLEMSGPSAEDVCTELETLLNGQMMGRTRKRPDAEGEEDERNVEELLRAMKRSLRSWLDTKVAFTVPSAIFPPAVVPSASRVPVAPGARDPTQIFRCITMSKNAITIPRANFTRLKQMLVDGVAMPGAGAMCHDSAVAQTPAEMERISEDYNDRIRTMKSKIEQALKKHAATMCDPLPVILDTVHERMAELHRIAGPTTIQTIIDRATRACDGPQLLPFTTYWHNYVEQRKPRARINGEEPPDDVNMTMQAYFAHFRNMTIALIPRIKEMTYELTTFTEDYERTLSVLIRKLVELYGNKAPEEAKLLVEEARSSLSRCQAIVQSRVEIGLREMQDRFTEIQTDCDDIWETIKAESKNTAPGRIERIGKKDMRKRIKKLESTFQGDLKWLKDYFATIFPSFYLVFLGYSVLRGYIHQLMFWQSRVYEVMIDELQESMDDINQGMARMEFLRTRGMLHGSSSLACALAVLFRDEVDRLYEDWKTSKAQNTLMDEIQEEDGAKQQPQKHLVLHDAVTVSSAETLADTVTAGKKKKKKTKNKNKSATAGTLSDKLAAAIGAGHTTPQGSPAKAEGVNDAVTASGSSPIKFPPGFEMLEDDQSMSETVLGDFESAVDANDLRENDGGGRLDGALRGGVQLQRPDPIEEERPTRSSSASIAESMASTPSTMSPTNKANAAKTEQWKQQQLLQLQNSKISSTLQKTSTVQTEEQVASLAHLRTVESRVAVLEEENLALKREMQTLTAQLPLVLDKLQQSETDRAALQDFCAQDRVLIDELRAQVEMLHKTVGAVQLRLQQQQADASPEPRRNVVNMPPGFARSPFGRGGLPPIGSELQRQDAHPITPGFSLFDGAVFPARRGLVPPSSGAGIIGGGLPAGGSGVASGDGSK